MINAENIPTRERLFKIAYGSEAHPEEVERMALALLAMLDAKPVAWQWFYYKQWHVTNDEERARDVAWEGKVEVQPLYTSAMLQSGNSPVVPNGYSYRLIPNEGTDAFNAACSVAFEESKAGTGPCGVFIAGHRAMLNAAPQHKKKRGG